MKYAIDNKNINDCYNEFNNLLVTLTNKHLKATTVKHNKYKHIYDVKKTYLHIF